MSNIKLLIKKKPKVVKSQPKKKRKTSEQTNVKEITEKMKTLDINIEDNTVFAFIHIHSLIGDKHNERYKDGFYLISILFDINYELKLPHKKKRYDKWVYGSKTADIPIDALIMDSNNSIKYYNFYKENNNILWTSTKKYSKYTIKFIYVKHMFQNEANSLDKKWRTYFNFIKINEPNPIDAVFKHSHNTHIDNKINIIKDDKVVTTIKTKVIFKEIQKNKMKLLQNEK